MNNSALFGILRVFILDIEYDIFKAELHENDRAICDGKTFIIRYGGAGKCPPRVQLKPWRKRVGGKMVRCEPRGVAVTAQPSELVVCAEP